jgi:nitroimidazol reductase NimA-like FMN-containing flavoprotein (pyridoxamine 5'-phosphate oxidase superfamily)
MSDDKKYSVQRKPNREIFDKNEIYELLDSEFVAHVGFIDLDNGSPFVIPLGFVRDGDRVLLHGSTGSRLFMQMAKGIELCITVTRINSLISARTPAHCSMNYESVMIFGIAKVLNDDAKTEAMKQLSNKLIPGVWDYARLPNSKDYAGTLIVEVPLDRVTAKSRKGVPVDEDEDMKLNIWAGTIPIERKLGAPITAEDSLVKEVPDHILNRGK